MTSDDWWEWMMSGTDDKPPPPPNLDIETLLLRCRRRDNFPPHVCITDDDEKWLNELGITLVPEKKTK